jgi:hypothetical protein
MTDALISIGVPFLMAFSVGSLSVRLSLYLKTYEHIWMRTTNVEEEYYYAVWFLITSFFLFTILILPKYLGVDQLLSDVILGITAGLAMFFFPCEKHNKYVYFIPVIPFLIFLVQFSI